MEITSFGGEARSRNIGRQFDGDGVQISTGSDSSGCTLYLNPGSGSSFPNCANSGCCWNLEEPKSHLSPLSAGWNLRGTPYPQTAAWSSVTVTRGAETKNNGAIGDGWIKEPFYRWTGTRYDSLSSGGTFQPLAGYWMRVFVEGCTIVFPQP